ncbi:16052_t:CDS:2 [Funneliformis geosporum]|uniref:7511_t:CDS:1 n=1 Tax=Funneliformis geosporum TaxID=1117311 RepID=A0A9W4T290_9GLOM|nr:16052_t:CDS:2 [Funneliformis geosporum]CAI2189875.1 7511_t:CDS:2 [Funneliformis geosporum]
MNVKKTHGCHPIGNLAYNDYQCQVEYNGVKLSQVLWDPYYPVFEITTDVPPGGHEGTAYAEALGHFSLSIAGDSMKFINNPIFVNGHHCDKRGNSEVNPFKKSFLYDEKNRPANGSVAEYWISIYWNCNVEDIKSIECCHKDVYYTNTINYG